MQGAVFKTIIKKKARIEIIPLIYVIFFLLATFVLFTLSLHKLTVRARSTALFEASLDNGESHPRFSSCKFPTVTRSFLMGSPSP